MALTYPEEIGKVLAGPNFVVQTSKQISSDYGITAAMRLWDDASAQAYAVSYVRAFNAADANNVNGVTLLFHTIGVKHKELVAASRIYVKDVYRRWTGEHRVAQYPLDDGFVDTTDYDVNMRKLDNWIARIANAHGINPSIAKSALITKMVGYMVSIAANTDASDNAPRLFGVSLIPFMGTRTAPSIGSMTYGSSRGMGKRGRKGKRKGGRKKKRYY